MRLRIHHRCGHIATANITGPGATREDRATWLATQVCPYCARQQRVAQYDAANQAATARAHAAGWPPLTGTPKQTAWAETIRAGALDAMSERLHNGLPACAAAQALFLWSAAALRETRAEWWIDHQAGILRAINTYTLTAHERSAINSITSTAGGET
ncbi:hypothetical protein ACFWXO_16430 [Kitasatospora sp. NPDC059088]|uniref:hypothetical protein n=1 Tax=Kitasatospora sp. NPDC059088 TaxID=3346722 RepID=UPI0036CDFE2B